MRLAVVAAVCLSIVGLAVAADAPAAMTKMPTNIPAQGLGPALKTLAKDRGFQVVFRSEVVGSARTQGATGNLTTPEALTELLKGTDLSFSYLDENTVTIVPRAGAQSDSVVGPQGAPAPTGDSNTTIGKEKQKSDSFRVAQVDQASTGPQAVVDNQNSEKKKKDELTEIIVTGTNIRGSANPTSPIIQYDRASIEQSGYLNTQEFIQSIPQAFGGGGLGASPDGNLSSGGLAGINVEHATAVNLRGLGENATLVLLNGHRMAPSDYGNIVDVSAIPLSAIDHIDVLTDGASAIYGADAVAGVVNIVLRKGFDGAETHVSYGGAAGGFREQTYGQTLGTTWSTGSIMASFEYNHEDALPTSERSFTSGVPQPTNIINPFTKNSLVVNGNQYVSDKLELYSDALLTWKQTSSLLSYGPGSTSSIFANPSAINLHLGLSYAISERWFLDVSGTYARQKTDVGYYAETYPFAPLGQAVIFFTTHTPEADAKVSGRLWSLPGGDVSVALGAARRREDAQTIEDYPPPPSTAFSRNITAEFSELRVPIVGAANAVPFVDQLIVTAAVRHDQYSDVGGTTNPKVGFLWSPAASFDVKANWSSAFRPPSLGELFSNASEGPMIGPYPFANPSAPGGTVPVLVIGGENSHLEPEKAKTYDIGLDFHPSLVPGLKVSLDYYSVDFHDRLITPTFDVNALLHPNVYGPLIGHLPSDAAVDAYVASLEAQGYQLTDFGAGTSLAGVRYTFPNQTINAAIVHQNGADLTGRYAFSLGGQDFRSGLNVAFINKIDTQYAPGAAVTNLVNTYTNPLRLKFRWDGTWTHGPLELTTAVNYSNSYANPYSNPPASVGSFTTVDVSAAFRLGADSTSFLRGTTLRLNATNLLDRAPPFATGGIVSGVDYDVGNASPLGRILSVEIRKAW